MGSVKVGDKVKVEYKGTLDNGIVFDSSEGREPLQFTVGKGMVIVGFEEGVKGMEVGESKTISISSANAYGARKEDMVVEVEKTSIPADIELEEGMQMQLKTEDGEVMNVMVIHVGEDTITLDGNHPLAGKDLTFEIKVLEII